MKNLTRTLSILLVAVTLLLASVVAYSAWPADSGADISQSLSSGYEPSGAVWHDELEMLIIVGDDGDVSKLEADGSKAVTYHPGGDLEGVTLVGDYVYVVVENPDTIKEFSLDTGSFTGKQWTLTSWLTGSSNLGAEAITWLPEEELFAVGLQADGRIYLFDVNLDVGEDVSYEGLIEPSVSGTRISSDISGLHYDGASETLFVVYDSWNILLEMQEDSGWETVASYSLAGSNQEGVAVDAEEGVMWIAEDSGDVLSYSSYPFSVEGVVDSDGDGLSDSEEESLGTDVDDSDSDNDKLSDYDEVKVYETNPLVRDTDGDSYSDWREVIKHGTDPLDVDDRRPERILDYEIDGNEVTIEYASGRSYTMEPFGEEEIVFAWINKWGKSLKITDGNTLLIIRNGKVIKEWVPLNPTVFLKRVMERYG
tara:strand:+ start:5033 stop:6304 length:1272 start_codon:yes stop_codon:yes gene_type:complete